MAPVSDLAGLAQPPPELLVQFGEGGDAVTVEVQALGQHLDLAEPAIGDAARAIRSGSVAINTPYAVFPGVPFGGYKQSGYGRELGMETMRLYSETKSVLTYIGEKPIDPFGV